MSKIILEQILKDGWEAIKRVLHHKDFLYLVEILKTKVTNRYHNDTLVVNMGIDKTQKLITQKYHWLLLRHNDKIYIKACNIRLAFKDI